jgi:two-component system, LytTR family, response regulator LytT
MNCIIIDDEATARTIINQLCSEIPDLKVVGEFENALQGIKYLKKNAVDVILLDFHLPDFSAFEFIDALKLFDFKDSLKKIPEIILTTSDSNFAIDAYEYDCIIDYLLKPISSSRFKKAITKAKNTNQQELESSFVESEIRASENQIFVNIDRRLIKIDISSICSVEAKGDYIHLKTDNGNHIVHSSLKKIQDKLPSNIFLKVHRSYLINIKKIVSIEDNTVLINKDIIPISRSSRTELMRCINLL